MNIRKIGAVAVMMFTLFCSVCFLVDAAQRWTGNLRLKTADAVHVVLAPAYFHNGQGERTHTFAMTEPVFVHESYRKLQSCHTAISNVFFNKTTGYMYRGETYMTWIRAGDYEMSENIELPRNIVPGTYRFLRKTVSFCGVDQVYYTMNFDETLVLK